MAQSGRRLKPWRRGELPLVPVMAAAANVIQNALEKRFYNLPLSPNDWECLRT